MTKFYLTTAIPYANAAPHIGTAMDYVYADALLRYHLLKGDDAKLSIGTDEHGTKVEQKALANGKTPQQFVDDLQPEFQKMRAALNLALGTSLDEVARPLDQQDFIKQHILNVRTSDPTHCRRVQEIWRKLVAAGVIYKGKYEGWACTGCEAFVTDQEAKDNNYICPDHKKPYDKLSEENYYLKVSQFTPQIKEFIKRAVVPSFRGKELLALIGDEAKDVSVSRPRAKLNWGVPVPDDDSQVMYVWVDALSNYLTVLGYPDNFKADYWPAAVEVVGKDIIRFHAIIWPAILLALGLELPQKLMVHGHIGVNGTKMSKSLGNVVSPLAVIDEYGVDAFRYYLIRHIPTFDDGDYTPDKFAAAYNGELANDLGNLVARVSAMLRKYFDGDLSKITDFDELKDATETMTNNYRVNMDALNLAAAAESVFNYIHGLNQYIEQVAPWRVAKQDEPARTDRLVEIFSTLVNDINRASLALRPFMPGTADKIQAVLGGDYVPAETPILFPRLEDERASR